MSYISCFVCFVAISISVVTREWNTESEFFSKEYDLLTVTVGDFTVEMEVTDEQYKKFVEEE